MHYTILKKQIKIYKDWINYEREFGFKAKTTFEVGLQRTIDWYRENML